MLSHNLRGLSAFELFRSIEQAYETGRGLAQAARAFHELAQRAGGNAYIRRLGEDVRRRFEQYFRTPERSVTATESQVSPAKRLKTLTEAPLRMPRGFPLTSGSGGGSASKYVDALKSNKPELAKLQGDGARYFNLDNGQAVLSNQLGSQYWSSPFVMMDKSQIIECFGDAATQTDMDPSYSEQLRTMSIYLKDGWLHLDIYNASNATAFIEIYDVRPKKDLARMDAGYPTPAATVFAGFDAISGAFGNYNQVGADPFMSQQFVESYSVYKTTKVMLGPGEWHTHEVHWSPNMLVKGAQVYDQGGYRAPEYLERLTYFPLIRFHGQPVIGNQAGPVDAELATYASVKLGVVYNSRVEYTFLQPNFDFARVTDNLTTSLDNPTIVLPTGAFATNAVVDPA